MSISHAPDILDCLANLSSDEVFTSPDLANSLLDLLPQNIFKDPNAKFLDPCCKTGVFLREIVKRLNEGLKPIIPDVDKRINHILKNQIFGIAITDLTAIISRRTLYCSNKATSKFSVVSFESSEGNISYKNINHKYTIKNLCSFCGISRSNEDEDNEDSTEFHAYNFIHADESQIEGWKKMKFDVVIGNPPYQLKDGGAQASAKPIYHLFIEQAKRIGARYISMIVPARWYAGGKGLDRFRADMIGDKCLKELHDFEDASDCFKDVEIKGGVCYFLWDRNYKGDCKFVEHKGNEIISTLKRPLKESGSDSIIRYNHSISILHKIMALEEKSFMNLVSTRKPFGYPTNYKPSSKSSSKNSVMCYGTKQQGFSPVPEKNCEWVNEWKIFVPKAIGSGNMKMDKVKPFIGGRNTCCTETYLLVGPFSDKKTAENVSSYISTKFFHFMLGLKKITQDASNKVYQFIPMQDFTKKWSDELLFKKYKLTKDEIEFIKNMTPDF